MPLICAVHCSYTHGYGAIEWSMVHLPEATHLRKIDSHILKAINYQQLLSWGWRLGRSSPTPWAGFECWLDCSYSALTQAATAAMSSWAQQSCHSQKTKLASSPSWPLATALFGPPLPGWSLSLGRRGVIEMSSVWLSTVQAHVLCTWTSRSHAVLHICPFQKGHGNVFLGESGFTRH